MDGKTNLPFRALRDTLGVPIDWNEETQEINLKICNKKTPVSDKTIFCETGVSLDKETAYAVGKVLLEKYAGKAIVYETDKKRSYLKVNY